MEWAVAQGVETATFHVLTPYPGTALFRRMEADGRLLHRDWDLYDTRHAVFRPARMTPAQLEEGYWRAYRDFYRWGAILRGAATKPDLAGRLRHAAYASAGRSASPSGTSSSAPAAWPERCRSSRESSPTASGHEPDRARARRRWDVLPSSATTRGEST